MFKIQVFMKYRKKYVLRKFEMKTSLKYNFKYSVSYITAKFHEPSHIGFIIFYSFVLACFI